MNDWGIPADDDINPLGPTPTGPDAEPVERGDVAEEFTDGTGTVTLGVDDDGVIVAIRIKNSWRDSGKGLDIDSLILGAAMYTHTRKSSAISGGRMVHPTMPDVDPRRLTDPDYFDEQLVREIEAGFAELAQPVDPDQDGYRDTVDFTPAEGVSTNRKVTVILGPGKLLQDCIIDDSWSAGARAETIAATFLEAHDRAVASYSEPVVIPGFGRERVQRAQDIAQMTLDLLAGRSTREGEDSR